MSTTFDPFTAITDIPIGPGNSSDSTSTSCKILTANNFLYIPATVVMIILAFLEKRRYRPDVCHGRPGLIVPLFSLDGHESRVSVAAAFGAITNIIVQLFQEDGLFCFKTPLWAKALMFQLRAFGAFVLCMPFVACLASRHRLVGAFCCFGYTAASAVVLILNLVTKFTDNVQDTVVVDILSNLPIFICYVFLLIRSVYSIIICFRTKKYKRTTNVRLVYPHQQLHVKNLLAGCSIKEKLSSSKTNLANSSSRKADLQTGEGQGEPAEASILANLRAKLRLHSHQNRVAETRDLQTGEEQAEPAEASILANLRAKLRLHSKQKEEKKEAEEKEEKEPESCVSKHIYKWHDDFKFPVRIIATVAVVGNIIYWFTLLLIGSGTALSEVKFLLEIYVNETIVINGVTLISPRVIDAFVVLWYLTTIVSSLMALLHVLLFVRNYKTHIQMLLRGNRTCIPADEITPQYAMACSMRFSGYSIAFMLWGQILSFTCILFIASVIGYLIYFVAENGLLVRTVLYLLQIISVPVTFFIIFYLQTVLAKHALLQRKLDEGDPNPPLSIDNRRVAEVVNYYALFANMTIGLGACIKRILFGAAIGVFTVGRVDLCQLRRGLETKDGGYMAYVGLLYLDHAHNNPVVRVFCKLLLRTQKKGDLQEMTPTPSRQTSVEIFDNPSIASLEDGLQGTADLRSREISRRARIRWHVALTMIRNPDLFIFRKWHLLTLAREELREEEDKKKGQQEDDEASA